MSGRYVDFAVGIESAAGGGYRVRAFSPDAEAESITRLEFDPDRLHAALRSRMSSALPKSRARDLAGSAGSMGGVGGVGSVGSAGAATAGLDLTEVGRGLFAALFTDEVEELYSAAWSAALAANQGSGSGCICVPGTPSWHGSPGCRGSCCTTSGPEASPASTRSTLWSGTWTCPGRWNGLRSSCRCGSWWWR